MRGVLPFESQLFLTTLTLMCLRFTRPLEGWSIEVCINSITVSLAYKRRGLKLFMRKCIYRNWLATGSQIPRMHIHSTGHRKDGIWRLLHKLAFNVQFKYSMKTEHKIMLYLWQADCSAKIKSRINGELFVIENRNVMYRIVTLLLGKSTINNIHHTLQNTRRINNIFTINWCALS